MFVRIEDGLNAGMEVKNLILFNEFAMHKAIPVFQLLDFKRNESAARFGRVQKGQSGLIVLVLFLSQLVQFLNHLLNRACNFFLQILGDPWLKSDFGSHLLIQYTKSDIFEISNSASLVIVKDVLLDNMDQKDILLIDFLFILLNSVGERPLFVPSQA